MAWLIGIGTSVSSSSISLIWSSLSQSSISFTSLLFLLYPLFYFSSIYAKESALGWFNNSGGFVILLDVCFMLPLIPAPRDESNAGFEVAAAVELPYISSDGDIIKPLFCVIFGFEDCLFSIPVVISMFWVEMSAFDPAEKAFIIGVGLLDKALFGL